MKVKIAAYGIARDIISDSDIQADLAEGARLAELRQYLLRKYPAFGQLASLKLAVNESYEGDDYELVAGDEVVIIPPVSGG